MGILMVMCLERNSKSRCTSSYGCDAARMPKCVVCCLFVCSESSDAVRETHFYLNSANLIGLETGTDVDATVLY